MLLNGITVLSLIVALGGFFLNLYELPVAFLTFLITYFSLVLYWCVFAFIVTRFIDFGKEYEEKSNLYRWLINCICESAMQIFRTNVVVTGKEKLPSEKFLIVCNHRSCLDPLITSSVLRMYNIGFVAKDVIFKIPVLSRLMHRCYSLRLDRNDMKQSARTISRASYYIKNNFASMGIYPEGVRSQKSEMLPFMHGAFKVAKKAGCPIVVATITDTDKATKHFFYKRTKINLDFIDVLSKDYVNEHNTVDLSNTARSIMEDNLLKYHM